MIITLGAITLHPKMTWTNEFNTSSVVVEETRTISGKLIRQRGTRLGGRSIILTGGPALRSLLVSLRALQDLGVASTLTLQDGRTFLTEFDGNDSINSVAPAGYYEYNDNEAYELELKLVEVVI